MKKVFFAMLVLLATACGTPTVTEEVIAADTTFVMVDTLTVAVDTAACAVDSTCADTTQN